MATKYALLDASWPFPVLVTIIVTGDFMMIMNSSMSTTRQHFSASTRDGQGGADLRSSRSGRREMVDIATPLERSRQGISEFYKIAGLGQSLGHRHFQAEWSAAAAPPMVGLIGIGRSKHRAEFKICSECRCCRRVPDSQLISDILAAEAPDRQALTGPRLWPQIGQIPDFYLMIEI
ncbi:uncharacterized protein F5147DRAFT_653559 [Suillus discolor]|uniref:Uncharacterized protein n=1 Tax=Suillus discolor TaxID=1912936 RepID=A0A9P7F5P1_9AGAM|nr:uncharacterized protein F5147DRAFT_653559 [Suillus discolor]KAG2106962.1 hypothetical protein F5147DRAFT_653559 [Suillus discolor]